MPFLAECANILIKYWPSFFLGIKTTILIAFSGTIIGLALGLLVGGIRAIKLDKTAPSYAKILKRIYDTISWIYIEVFRGTPMMVQAVFLYYALRPVFNWSYIPAGIFVISVNTGAYMAEIVRSGIQSIDVGQTEAARSLGMSNMQTMMNVILPQAIKNAFPSIGNEFIVNIKDSSVLMIISITELMFQAKSIAGSTYKFTETYFVTACVYLVMTMTTSFILNQIEKKLNHTKTTLPQSDTFVKTMNLAKEDQNHERTY
ncbi:MAG: amino acid ABC transporter permease [Erysipelotrichaceae bacterium]|nr:amino acid ABC transporter permease [Erysipelotrichaceae bacterium]MDY5251325.1 amino acid ABC transporter permease [Erysipelotrichaceae bacterium]